MARIKNGVSRATDAETDLARRLRADIEEAGGALQPAASEAGAIGFTMFDLPASEDNTVTVLLDRHNLQQAPSQGLVRIRSGDGRTYLGIVSAGPFAEPDSLRADSHMLVTVTTRGGTYLPPFHGRVQVSILGEELPNGSRVPPRLRPLPNSAVFALTDEESAAVLQAEGDLRLGLVVGHQNVVVGIPSRQKLVLPRHLAILGTTGSGKSTTVAGLVQQAQAAGMAVLVLDVEGEYTHLHEATDNEAVCAALAERGLAPAGLPAEQTTLYHLVGRDTANPAHPDCRAFSLQFAQLSPHAAMDILDLNDAQQDRFLKAYDVAKELLRDLGIFPQKDADAGERARQERMAMELDEFERGYPRLTLSFLIDVAGACLAHAERAGQDKKNKACVSEPAESFRPFNAALATPAGLAALRTRIHSMHVPGIPSSWRALLGKLWRLNRLKVFFHDGRKTRPLHYAQLLQPGRVSILDLSDSGASALNNIVLTDLLRGVQAAQDRAYRDYEKARASRPDAPLPPRVLIVIEEAHEFLSAGRVDKMRNLFDQVARIAKRGRKRWLSLAFVTQLPQHLPREVFGLVNSYILHKITDPHVVSTLQHTVSGIDAGLWNRLSGLAPGQAIVSFPHLARPLLVAIDPAPGKLRMVD